MNHFCTHSCVSKDIHIVHNFCGVIHSSFLQRSSLLFVLFCFFYYYFCKWNPIEFYVYDAIDVCEPIIRWDGWTFSLRLFCSVRKSLYIHQVVNRKICFHTSFVNCDWHNLSIFNRNQIDHSWTWLRMLFNCWFCWFIFQYFDIAVIEHTYWLTGFHLRSVGSFILCVGVQ